MNSDFPRESLTQNPRLPEDDASVQNMTLQMKNDIKKIRAMDNQLNCSARNYDRLKDEYPLCANISSVDDLIKRFNDSQKFLNCYGQSKKLTPDDQENINCSCSRTSSLSSIRSQPAKTSHNREKFLNFQRYSEDVFAENDFDNSGKLKYSSQPLTADKDSMPKKEGLEFVQQVSSKCEGLHEIAGLDDVKQNLRESIIYPLRYPHLFTRGRQTWSRALLFGPPGVGKTVIVQAAAAEAGLPLYQVSSADIMSAWLGHTEKQIRELFTQLGCERCILFIDEIDALCRKRTGNDPDHTRRMQTELLIQMQNYEGRGMFLVCATNCPWDLDPAFLRRFQQRIYVPMPDFETRESLFLSSLCLGLMPTIWTGWTAFITSTQGLTGSDIKNIIRAAMMYPLREMQNTNFWKKTIDGKFVPSMKDHLCTLNCSVHDLPPELVWCRDVNISDLQNALKKCSLTVTEETLAPFKKFISEYSI